MPAPTCLRCLSRSFPPLEASLLPPATTRAFSTTSSRSRTQPAKKASVQTGAKQGKRLQLKKTTRVQSSRPTAPGERKAYRKRIVLSNTNALEVPGLQDLTADKVLPNGEQLALQTYQGKMLGLPNETVDSLRALETFQPAQGWSLFRRPATLIRRETLAVAEDVVNMTDESKNGTARVVLDGAKVTGKSVLLLQAQAMALQKGCVIVHFPEAQDLINAHTAYQPLDTTEGTLYIQPHYIAKLLGSIAKANQAVLSTLQLSGKHDLPVSVQSNMSLARFAELGAEDHTLAWPVWQALWTELTAPSQPDAQGLRRPPVMISMDGIDHIMRPSAYLAPDNKPIHAHDLALVKTFTDFLSGKRTLPNGGLVVGATCASNQPSSPTLRHMLAVASTPEGERPPRWDPYVKQDERVAEAMKGVEVLMVQGLSKREATGVMEYYAQSGMVREMVTDRLTAERWTMAGGGVIGELERAAVRLRYLEAKL